MKQQRKAIALISSGLDSMLAAKTVMEQYGRAGRDPPYRFTDYRSLQTQCLNFNNNFVFYFRGITMKRAFTLEYWQDDGWYVGKLKEIPGVFSQGETLAELEENIEDAYKLMMEDQEHTDHPVSQLKEILVEVA